MKVFAERLGVVTICAVLVWGCAGESGTGPDLHADAVQNITHAQARGCRVVDTLRVENQFSRDEDIERGALRKARALAVEKGGDAIMIQSTSVTPSRSVGGSSVMTLKGQILVCRSNVSAN